MSIVSAALQQPPTSGFSAAMSSQSVADRRRQVLVGELPPDFLRLIVPREQEATSFPQQQLVYAGGSFVPPNTRGRVSITIADANLVRNYGIVRMDPYCRLRVGHAVFETQTKLSGGRSPVWNRTVHAYLPNGVESIYIQIFDEKAFGADECVAWAHVMLPQAIFSGETIDDYYPLSGQQGEGKEGMLHLIISFAPVDATVSAAAVLPSTASPPLPGNKDATVSALLEMSKNE
ncbi:C2 domain protein [Ancylostoma ceylanicum]|uniref:C2 domain protein n=1 Tax=Ancylostoma ceylanicum TaxID=53326 RepID=A0A0D6LWX4_9BILA|nr:C2 domain protein [Ancylostoma ceylanicum]